MGFLGFFWAFISLFFITQGLHTINNKNEELKPKKSPKAHIQSPSAKVQISIVKIANTQGLKLQLLKFREG